MDDQQFGKFIRELQIIRWSALIAACVLIIGLFVLIRQLAGPLRARFSIRDLLWLTVVAALAVGWWLDHAIIQQERQRISLQQVEMNQKIEDLDKLRDSVRALQERQGLK